jgi:hypothetical protein
MYLNLTIVTVPKPYNSHCTLAPQSDFRKVPFLVKPPFKFTLKANPKAMSFISLHAVCWTRLSAAWWRFNRLFFFLFASSMKQEAPGNTDNWISTMYINVHHLRFNIMSYLYGLMSLRDSELRVYLSTQFNYSCFLDLFWFVSSALRFKSAPAPLNISHWLHNGDTPSVCLSLCLSVCLSVCTGRTVYTITIADTWDDQFSRLVTNTFIQTYIAENCECLIR